MIIVANNFGYWVIMNTHTHTHILAHTIITHTHTFKLIHSFRLQPLLNGFPEAQCECSAPPPQYDTLACHNPRHQVKYILSILHIKNLILYMQSWKNQPHQATRGQSIFNIKENWQPSTTCIENFTACTIMYIVVHESIKQADLFIHIKTHVEKFCFIVLRNYHRN